MPLIRPELAYLPLAQTIWYLPTGLDPVEPAPRQDARATTCGSTRSSSKASRRCPRCTGRIRSRSPSTAPLPEKLNTWLTLVQRGEVINAYRVFLGLWEEAVGRRGQRTQLLAQLVFAGLIDVQDRMLHNRSYTTGHKSLPRPRHRRARPGGRLGARARASSTRASPTWRSGPRWYSTYEMGCQVVQNFLDGRDRGARSRNDGAAHRRRSRSPSIEAHAERRGAGVHRPDRGAAQGRAGAAPDHRHDPARLGPGHPRDGRPEQLLDAPAQLRVLQHGAAGSSTPSSIRTGSSSSSWPPPSSTAAAHHQRHTPDNGPAKIAPPKGADALPRAQLLERLDDALDWRCGPSRPWTGPPPTCSAGTRPRAARPDARDRRGQGGQRPAQPGARALPARGLRAHAPRADRDRLLLASRQAHRRAPEVRQPSRRLEAIRRRLRSCPLLTTFHDHRPRLLPPGLKLLRQDERVAFVMGSDLRGLRRRGPAGAAG